MSRTLIRNGLSARASRLTRREIGSYCSSDSPWTRSGYGSVAIRESRRAISLLCLIILLYLGLGVSVGSAEEEVDDPEQEEGSASVGGGEEGETGEGEVPVEATEELFARCSPAEFPESIEIEQVSGAAWFQEEERDYLLVVADAGAGGAGGIVSLNDGSVEPVVLPLGDFEGDDLEGLASPDGRRFYGLTSSGWLRMWTREGFEFSLEEPAYAISNRRGMVCEPAEATNCERNWEGICLHPLMEEQEGGCVGWVASRTDGSLYCLVRNDASRLAVDRRRSIALVGPERLSDCSFGRSAPYPLVALTNGYDNGRVRHVMGYSGDSLAYQVQLLSVHAPGFAEAIAILPDGFITFSDNGPHPSRVGRFRCH